MIKIPRPPSTNSLYFNRKRGRTKTKKYTQWIIDASYEVAKQKPEQVNEKCAVSIRVEKRGKVKEDIDNRIKATLDLLVATEVITDDRLVWRVTAEWADIKDCEVTVEPWKES